MPDVDEKPSSEMGVPDIGTAELGEGPQTPFPDDFTGAITIEHFGLVTATVEHFGL